MKHLLAVGLLASAFCIPAFAMNEVPQPDIRVGSNWTFKRIDMVNNKLVEGWKLSVEGSAPNGYQIGHYALTGNLLRTYVISKNLGQGSPVGSDKKMGDGNLYMFPLTVGKTWTTRSYWTGGRVKKGGAGGYDEITYKVVGEQTLTVEAGTFKVVKVVGTGVWKKEDSSDQGSFQATLYYSPEAKTTVRSERSGMEYTGIPQHYVDTFELSAYELK